MEACITFPLPRAATVPPGVGYFEAIEAMCMAVTHMRLSLESYEPAALGALGESAIRLPPALWMWANTTMYGGAGRSVLEFFSSNWPSIKFAMARLPAEDSELQRLADVRLDMRNAAVKEEDAWRRWAGEVGGRPDWNGHNDELRALVMDRLAERDATIKDLRELLEFKRAEIASLSREVQRMNTPHPRHGLP